LIIVRLSGIKKLLADIMDSRLSEYFIFAAGKSLSAVDAVPSRSNQHEIGGLVKVGFGEAIGHIIPGEKLQIPCLMVWLSDDDDNSLISTTVTWYDTRAGKAHRASEYRLYYPGNEVTERIGEGDFLLTALRHDNELVICFAPKNSQVEWQLRSLFGLGAGNITDHRFHSAELSDKTLLLPIRLFLEEMGIIFEPEVDLMMQLWSGCYHDILTAFLPPKFFQNWPVNASVVILLELQMKLLWLG
jgi:hypothetical protein